MGLGRFGGGVGVVRWLAAQGCDVLVTDLDPAERLGQSLAQIEDLVRAGAVALRLGGHNVSDFTDTDLVVANPAVPMPWENRFLRAAQAAGVPITTEIRLLIERLPNVMQVIGVTGSVGKSTTSAMIAHIMREAGLTVYLGGNIGGSLLQDVERIGADDWVVLELSSAMLHWLSCRAGYPAAPGWSPGIAVVTNILPNHLDWHGDFDHYRRSKAQILRHQTEGSAAKVHDSLREWLVQVFREDDLEGFFIEFVRDEHAAVLPALAVPGGHNRVNAAMAVSAACCAALEFEAAARAVATFPGLPDRLQYLGEFGGVRAYNDSKSTTPEAARLAIESMDDPSRVHLICGGYDKKIDLTPMAEAATRCRGVYTIGATGRWLAEHVRGAVACGTLDEAVKAARCAAGTGEVILLSPGCASWDQFTNYEERGRRFGELVRERMP